ncbi:16678_t:CDS:2 [Cetraspora pellucida]|uniref:16678_t:CDS:1 n=1 Tax=Cetraspora pellucida TaxID=1433469 RepID=A0A9N9BUR0_9GLOM|nr:16678_t:CDS:2 [Cetraspora pellucida]
MGKGLSLLEAIEQILANIEEEKCANNRFEYVVVENDLSQKVGDKMEYPEVPSFENLLKTLKKLKDDNKVNEDEVNKDEVDKEDKDEVDEDKKEAYTYAKNLYDTTYADKIVKCSGNDAYWSSFLSTLDKQKESIHIKLMILLAEISQNDIGSRKEIYKLVTKATNLQNTWYKVVGLEITHYRASLKLQSDKKNNSYEADIDDIIELYY